MFNQPKPKLNPNRAAVDTDGQRFRHIVVDLTDQHTIATAHEEPELWSAIQGVGHLRVKRGDRVTLISADGLTVMDQAPVLRAQGGSVHLGVPLRMIALEEVALFSAGGLAVWPVGTRFGIKHDRDGRVEEKTFHSEEAAKVELLKRRPARVA